MVDLADARFEYLETSESSLVHGAWYDEKAEYMVIRLRDTYYHYCRLPADSWRAFRRGDSYGRHYLAHLKGRYDCRLGGVPD